MIEGSFTKRITFPEIILDCSYKRDFGDHGLIKVNCSFRNYRPLYTYKLTEEETENIIPPRLTIETLIYPSYDEAGMVSNEMREDSVKGFELTAMLRDSDIKEMSDNNSLEKYLRQVVRKMAVMIIKGNSMLDYNKYRASFPEHKGKFFFVDE